MQTLHGAPTSQYPSNETLIMKLLLCLLAVAGLAHSQECGGTEFLCEASNVCIPQNRVCDGIADCLGGSDEVDCPSTTTTECPGLVCEDSGICIPESYICDGDNDCGNYEDEQGCPCDDGFTCPITGLCIPSSWICDGYNDCGDMSDEQGCATTSTTPCPGYVCPDGRCISQGWVCDGDNDCGDWSDESELACPCQDNEIRCPQTPGSQTPGACIPPEYICDEDGIWDCPDGSDEANCTMSVNTFDPKVPHYRLESIMAASAHQKKKASHKRGKPNY